jgi:uroporphyrinogen-III synthase
MSKESRGAETHKTVWAVLGTSSTVKKIVEGCQKIHVSVEPFQVVTYSVSEGVSTELAHITGLDTSVFTSQTASELVYKNASQELRESVRVSKCFAVGPATAEAIKHHFKARKVVVARPHTSEGLIDSLRNSGRLGQAALFSSVRRSDSLREYLLRHSTKFFEPKLYDLSVRAEEVARFSAFLQESSPQGVVFTCSTAVSAITRRVLPRLRSLRVLAMGPRTKKTLEALGVNALLPEDSTVDFIVSAIQTFGSLSVENPK